MAHPSALLVAMPWHLFRTPSLQIGLLQSVLQEAGIRTEAATLSLAFMEYCCAQTAGLPADEQIGIGDYSAVATACEDGATAAEALAGLEPAGSHDLDVDDVTEFLDELVELRLAFEEGGRYLALALPPDLLEAS